VSKPFQKPAASGGKKPGYYVRIKLRNGKWVERKAGRTASEAKRFQHHHQLIEDEFADGRRTVETAINPQGLTVADLARFWLKTIASERARPDSIKSKVNKWVIGGKLAEMQADDVEAKHVEDWLDDLKAGGLGPASRNKTLVVLNRCYVVAKEKTLRTGYIGPSPCNGIAKAEEPPWDFEIISGAETRRLFDTPAIRKGHRAPFLACAIWGLLRVGEIVALRRRDVDFERGLLHVRKIYDRDKSSKKGGHQKAIPLHPTLAEYLRQALEMSNHPTLVFPSRRRVGTNSGAMYSHSGHFAQNWLRPGLLQAGIDKPTMRVHDLRHTGVTQMLEAGMSPAAVQLMARHKDIRTTIDRYAHLNLGWVSTELEKFKVSGFEVAA